MKIRTFQGWSPEGVRQVCIQFDWYTRGCNEEYDKMLDYVRAHPDPTLEDIYFVAKDIMEHSRDIGVDVEAYMFQIGNKAVLTYYSVEEEE